MKTIALKTLFLVNVQHCIKICNKKNPWKLLAKLKSLYNL